MARQYAQNCHICPKMIGLLCLVTSILLRHGALSQRVNVEPEVLSYPGQTVNLSCAFTDATGVQLTMVTWIYEQKNGERFNIAVFHPNFDPQYPNSPVNGRVSFTASPPNLANPSIQISNVSKTDEGKYICDYALYPSGNEQGITSLVLLEVPDRQVKVEPEVASYPGQTVNLPCAFLGATANHLLMVTWIYEQKDGERFNIAVFHPNFDPHYPNSPVKGRVSFTASPPNLANPSIQISNVSKTDEGKYICECALFPSGNEQGITSLVLLEAPDQRVKVEPGVVSYPGQTVSLPCAFTGATGFQLTMVTWIYEQKDGERFNIAVFHPNFDPHYPNSPVKGRVSFTASPPNLANPSIQISNVSKTDEGKYICEFALYPSGNEQGITSLVLLEP